MPLQLNGRNPAHDEQNPATFECPGNDQNLLGGSDEYDYNRGGQCQQVNCSLSLEIC